MTITSVRTKIGQAVWSSSLITWFTLGQATLLTVNMSVWNFLLYQNITYPDKAYNAYLAASEVVRLVLYGWLLFTVFLRPGNKFLVVPSKGVRAKETSTMLLSFSMVVFWSSFLREILFIVGTDVRTLTNAHFVANVIAVTFITAYQIYRKIPSDFSSIQNSKKDPSGISLSHITSLQVLEAKALKKADAKLSQEEQEELALLMYKKYLRKRSRLKIVVRLIVLSLIFSFFQEIAVNFLQDL